MSHRSSRLGSSRLARVTVDPSQDAVPFGTTRLVVGWTPGIQGMLRMQVPLVWVARGRQNKSRKVMPQISADTIAEGDIHWIAAGAGLSIC